MAIIGEAPTLKNMQGFISNLGKARDLSKQARFLVRIGRFSNDESLMYLCDSAEFPSRSLETFAVRYYGPQFRLPYQSTYNDINLTFLVRDDMGEKNKFDSWIASINPKTSYDFNFLNEYSCDIDIYQYSEIKGIGSTYKNTLTRAYPTSVAALGLDWSQDAFHKLQVTFSYTDWFTVEEKYQIQTSTTGS